ncbi:MAG TPA: PTS fructose transporter subunit IIA [Thermoanaerobaculia bacterium]|nr:PTS fructose transporter subunit IIA [Thermoanaerobaculia bacterium]
MVAKLMVTQGEWAHELLKAAEVMLGHPAGVEEVKLDWAEDPAESKARLRAVFDRVDQGEGVLVLTDVIGGTPCNVAMSFLEPRRVEVVSGLNLPMILRLGCPGTEGMELSELARWLRGKAQASVCLGSEVAERPSKDEGKGRKCADDRT